MEEWEPYRDEFLAELKRHDKASKADGSVPACTECGRVDASFRCRDCVQGFAFCDACLLKDHMRRPLHRIEVTICPIPPYSTLTNHSNGTELSSFRPISAPWASASNSAMTGALVPCHISVELRPRFSILTASTPSISTYVGAAKATMSIRACNF